jgi:hypothetical protein
MTLLSICQDTADVVGLTRPTVIITGTDQLSRQLLGFAKKTLEELSIMDWPVLQVPYSFNTVAAQAAYDLPANFGREIGDSVYGAARYSQLRGSLTPGDWARQRNILPGLGFYRFRIFGSPLKLNLTPTPQGVETIVFEYQSLDRVVAVDGVTLKRTFTADNDTTVVPEDIMKKGVEWRIRRAKGMDYSEEFDDYEVTRAQRLAQAMQFGSMPVSYRGPYDSGDLPLGYVPENGYGA